MFYSVLILRFRPFSHFLEFLPSVACTTSHHANSTDQRLTLINLAFPRRMIMSKHFKGRRVREILFYSGHSSAPTRPRDDDMPSDVWISSCYDIAA
jgi:hypothetical protein